LQIFHCCYHSFFNSYYSSVWSKYWHITCQQNIDMKTCFKIMFNNTIHTSIWEHCSNSKYCWRFKSSGLWLLCQWKSNYVLIFCRPYHCESLQTQICFSTFCLHINHSVGRTALLYFSDGQWTVLVLYHSVHAISGKDLCCSQ
jgi:hypothetical protein